MKCKQITLIISRFIVIFIAGAWFNGIMVDYTDHYHFYKQCKKLELGEVLPYDEIQEQKLHDEIVEITKQYLTKEFNTTYQERPTTGKRLELPTHPTVHGCMNAKLYVTNNKSGENDYGIFQHNKEYDVVLKFTEESEVLWNWKPKMLALSMKIYGVSEPKLKNEQISATINTQDFIFQAAYGSYNDPQDYIDMYTDKVDNENINAIWNWFLKHPFLMYSMESAKWRGTWNTPFDEDLYNTIIAYKWKDTAAKFHLKPCTSEFHSTDYEHDIHHDILRQLAHNDICFTLYVQEQQDTCHHPIDIVSKYWSTYTAPLIPLGKILIPQGTVLYDSDSCSKFHFNLCNGLRAHKPLGKVSRARCATYGNISEFRIHQNLKYAEMFDVINEPRKLCTE